MIFDAQYWEKYGLQPLPPGSRPPEWIDSANTVGELARRIGVDADGLSETVERFNRFVAAGHDEDFQRGRMPWSRQASGDLNQKNANMGSLQPPFFALELKPSGSLGRLADQRQRPGDPPSRPCHRRTVRLRRRGGFVARRGRLPGGIESSWWNDFWFHGGPTRGGAIAPLSKVHAEQMSAEVKTARSLFRRSMKPLSSNSLTNLASMNRSGSAVLAAGLV